jgi:hypothetical protein
LCREDRWRAAGQRADSRGERHLASRAKAETFAWERKREGRTSGLMPHGRWER